MTITDFPATNCDPMPMGPSSPGQASPLANNHSESSNRTRAGSKTLPAASRQPMPIAAPPLGGDQPGPDQWGSETQWGSVGAGIQPGADADHRSLESHKEIVGVGPILYDPSLYLLAAQLDAIEGLRMATANRHRMATRDVADSDGYLRGLGLTEDNPAVQRSAVMLDALEKTEHEVVLGLNRIMRAHPLGGWQKVTRGVGEKTLARLLACIGDPYWNTAEDRPRTVSQLWAYCGLHVLPASGSLAHTAADPGHKRAGAHTSHAGVAARRAKGVRANWSTDAKTRVYLIAEACLKAGNYRDVYDDHKARAAAAVHVAPCPQCKEKEAGTPLKLGHQHARAMRAMSKQILKELWVEARRLHGAVAS